MTTGSPAVDRARGGAALRAGLAADLDHVVEEMAGALRDLVPAPAALSFHLAAGEVPVEADAVQLGVVVFDLVAAASAALGGQAGAITVATGWRRLDSHAAADFRADGSLAEGVYGFLEVSDTGAGMDAGTRTGVLDAARAADAKGQGSGLARALRIAGQFGGGLRVESAPGQGTRVTALFPTAGADEATLEEGPHGGGDAWEGQGAVLVVDDEELIRDLMTTVLEDAGFEVLTACDGIEALATMAAHADRIRLVLLDMVLPRMNGEKVHAEIRSRWPDTSIILMSGFSETFARGEATAGGSGRFLKKPFAITALLEAVLEAVDS